MANEGSGLQAEHYNNFPEGFEFMEMGKSTVILRLCALRDRSPRWDPISKSMQKPTPPAALRIRPTDQIMVSVEDEENKLIEHIVDVGYFRRTNATGEAEIDPLALLFGNTGEIRLSPNKPKDRRRFKYLVHTNYCEDFKWRTTDKKPIFYIVNPEKVAKENRDARKTKMEAYNAVSNLSTSQVKVVYEILGDGLSRGIEEQIDYLEELAENSPAKIVAAVNNHLLPYEEIAHKAVKVLKAIKHDAGKGQFETPEGQVLATYTKGRGSKPYTDFARELAKEESAYSTVKTLIAAAEEKASKPKTKKEVETEE